MVTETEVKRVFASYIAAANEDGLPDQIKISECQYVPIATFLTLFEGCSLTHASLAERDAGRMGYRAFFDRAKAEGVLR